MGNQARSGFANVNISDVQPNPQNPRTIKDSSFKKLVESIKSFPQMLDIRPIVLNNEKEKIILGGNQRYRACVDAGLKTIPVIYADNLTTDQQREFMIKDNSSSGDWDWDALANGWDAIDLESWGVDVAKLLPAPDHEDIGEDMRMKYVVEIECDSEANQQTIYESLIEKGYKCRILTL